MKQVDYKQALKFSLKMTNLKKCTSKRVKFIKKFFKKQ